MADEDVFYMKVEEPVEMRRNLLEADKAVLNSLQRYERFKELREQKAEKIIELRNAVKELTQLFIQLKNELPAVEILQKKEKHVSEKKKAIRKAVSSEVRDLQRELSKVEEKLERLA
jgi:DNA repair exonuclease SbcCD ATPase subunit